MKKLYFLFLVLSLVFNNAMAYDFITYAPSGQILYCNILDQNNHLIGLTSGTPQPSGDLIIPETIHCNGADWTVIEIMENAFRESTITSVIIPNTVTAIGNQAFYLCTQLCGTVTIPNSVNIVGNWAFCRCDRMTEVLLPAKDVTYGSECFMTTGLTGTLTLPEGLLTISNGMFKNNNKLTHVVISHTVTTISSEAFSNCDKLETVQIPASVTSIIGNPFNCSTMIESVTVEEGNSVYYSVNNSVIHQATNTLVIGCKNSIIPEGIVVIGPYAFAQCGLTEMPEIPSSVTTIGDCAFLSCNDHGSLVIPETVTSFGQAAFSFGRFSTVTVPHTISNIPLGMFRFCQWMDKLTIPESINNIGDLAFSWCTNLNKIYVYNPVPPTMNTSQIYHSFDRVPRSATVYVPTGCVEAYQNAPGWNEFEYIFEIGMFSQDAEWYYEILNDNGSITYQYLSCAADTTINDQPIHILVRINTLYDKEKSETITHEYVYEENNKVYWWNKTLGEFTTLYDFGAEVGDEWEIKVGTQTIPVHVDAAQTVTYKSQEYKMLSISDPDDIFTGDIICGIGHLTSFFPEKLMTKGYRVENIRCFWQDGELVYQNGDQDCDEIYEQHHLGVDEIDNENGFVIYPNPSNDVIFVKTCHSASLQSEYRITNIMGQTLMIGEITSENQMIDVSSLTKGIYFITINNESQKFVIK